MNNAVVACIAVASPGVLRSRVPLRAPSQWYVALSKAIFAKTNSTCCTTWRITQKQRSAVSLLIFFRARGANERRTKNERQEPSSNGDPLVRVEGVSKIFCRSLKRSLHYGLMDCLSDILPVGKRKNDENSEPILRKEEFWAVKDVSFELRRGECLGLIGRNGAGKTTLLKMLNGLIKPDKGRIEMHGRVGALIALGAGFNPILTGRENIYVNGSILGLSKKEIEDKLDEIIDFSEIREFIDSPVQSYSSGMAVRLGFAVASSLNPDILLLDEVLAVGDFAFRMKCFERIGSLMRKAAVVFVSHNAHEVRGLCNHALYLSRGRSVYFGQVIQRLNDMKAMPSINRRPKKAMSIPLFEKGNSLQRIP